MDATDNKSNTSNEVWQEPAWKCITDHYEPLAQLGKGSHGTVIRAQCKSTGEKVAIKQIPNIFRSFDYAKRVLREVQVMKFLAEQGRDYPAFPFAVAKQFILSEPKAEEESAETSIFIVMEEAFATLHDVFNQAEVFKMSKKTATKMVYQLLVALRFLKSAGILHRDIKPSNILVDRQFNIRLTDFGLSRSFQSGPRPKGPRVRRFSNHVVSRWYRPPEVILLEKEYDETVDSWSTGCVIGELLTCTKPYLKAGSDKNLRWLFQGESCFPLSPAETHSKEDAELDQLSVILNTLGEQSEGDISFVTSKSASQYLKELVHSVDIEKIEFAKEFELSDPRLSEILHGLLEFNPQKRTEAGKLLHYSLFDEHRSDCLETLEPSAKLSLRVDQPDVFDYEKMEIGTGLKLKDLRQILIDEIQ